MTQSYERVQKGLPGGAHEGHFPGGSGPKEGDATRKPLGLFDAVSIIIGIVVGAGIYQTVPFILKNTDGPITALIAWGVCGVLSLIGALCYAELATTYPRTGGDYVYLGRAFGRWMGFLFGWVQLTVVLTGSIGMMAFIFADYFVRLLKAYHDVPLRAPEGVEMTVTWDVFGTPISENVVTWAPALGAVVVITLLNILGVVFGKVTQNVLSLAKVLGLGAIVVAGFMAPTPDAWELPGLGLKELEKVAFPGFMPSLGVAMVLILYTYGGWNDAAFVAAEVRNGRRNITWALVLGLLLVTLLYMLVNVAYINSLGFPGAQASSQIAADVLDRGFGRDGASAMCVLVMVSALGAINGLIFTGARVYSIVGQDHPVFSWMGGWSKKQGGTPVPALLTQGVITLGLIFLVGSSHGRDALNEVFKTDQAKWAGLKELKFDGVGGFDTLLTCTAPVFWVFFFLTGLAVFVLRERDKHLERPFKVPFYPALPLVFCATCLYMLYSSIDYALIRGWKGGLLLFALVPLLVGVLLWGVVSLVAPGKEAPDPADERPI